MLVSDPGKARSNQSPPSLPSLHTFVMSYYFRGPSIYQVPNKLPICDWQEPLTKPVCPSLCLCASPTGQELTVLSRGTPPKATP